MIGLNKVTVGASSALAMSALRDGTDREAQWMQATAAQTVQ